MWLYDKEGVGRGMSRYKEKYQYRILESDNLGEKFEVSPFTCRRNIADALGSAVRKVAPRLSMEYMSSGRLVVDDTHYWKPDRKPTYDIVNIAMYENDLNRLCEEHAEFYKRRFGRSRLEVSGIAQSFYSDAGYMREINGIERDFLAKVDLLKCQAMLRRKPDRVTMETAIELEEKFGDIERARVLREECKRLCFVKEDIKESEKFKKELEKVDAKIGFVEFPSAWKEERKKEKLEKSKAEPQKSFN